MHRVLYLLLLSLSMQALSSEPNGSHWVSASLDNDLFTGSDDGYTNGVFFSSFKFHNGPRAAESTLPWYLRLQNKLAETETARAWVKVNNFSQMMVTPTDIESVPPNTQDLPYAGFLLWQPGIAAIHDKSTTYMSFLVGTSGPLSFAEQSQKAVHKAIGSTIPQGWDFQLNNELLLGVSAAYFEQKHHWSIKNLEFDTVLGVYGSLGNLRSVIGSSAFIRLGKRLNDSHSVFAMFSGREINPVATEQSWFAYLGAIFYYELNNMIFQGNSSSGNNSLKWDKQNGGITAGLAYTKNKWGLSFSLSDAGSLGDRYYGRQRFGSVSLMYKLY